MDPREGKVSPTRSIVRREGSAVQSREPGVIMRLPAGGVLPAKFQINDDGDAQTIAPLLGERRMNNFP